MPSCCCASETTRTMNDKDGLYMDDEPFVDFITENPEEAIFCKKNCKGAHHGNTKNLSGYGGKPEPL